MSRISPRDFVGTRTRFQRLKDARIFNGWIEQFYEKSVEISISGTTPLMVGEEFRFEGFGNHISVVFNGQIDTMEMLDVAPIVDGSNAVVAKAQKLMFMASITSPIRFAASPETIRIQVPNITGAVTQDDTTTEVCVIDVGPNGVGISSPLAYEPGANVAVVLHMSMGEVAALANVRYCREDPERPGWFRCGLMFLDMGRVEKPRWERYIKGLN